MRVSAVHGIWFTVAFRQTITIARIAAGLIRRVSPSSVPPKVARCGSMRPWRGTAHAPPSRVAGVRQQYRKLGRSEAPLISAAAQERGRRRTRQDQISRKFQNRWASRPGEIADHGSAPNEENLFLLPDRFRKSELS